MSSCNFCIYENKVFDLNGYEILPDEDNIVTVFLNGMERRFKIDKMIVWLKESGYNKLFRKPKDIPKPKIVKSPREKIVKVKKERIVKVKIVKEPKPKKEKPIKVKKESKPPYQKKGYGVHGGNFGYPKRKIICSNGNVYDSLYEASKTLGLSRGSVYHVCTGKYKHTKGLTFNYV